MGNEHTEGQDSAPMRQLRKQLKEEQRARKALETQLESATADARAAVKREMALDGALESIGMQGVAPEVRKLIEERAGDNLDAESVSEAVQSLGFNAVFQSRPEVEVEVADEIITPEQEALNAVTSLSNQVSHMAQTGQNDNFHERLANTEKPEDIARLMAEIDP